MTKMKILFLLLAMTGLLFAAPQKSWDAIFGEEGQGEYLSAKIEGNTSIMVKNNHSPLKLKAIILILLFQVKFRFLLIKWKKVFMEFVTKRKKCGFLVLINQNFLIMKN